MIMKVRLAGILLLVLCLTSSMTWQAEWGFWGHRRINRMAVFTLPPEMISFYKKHIEYITEHAVDPDKRRYATRHEAVRHYIDIDHWGTYPFDNIPRDWVGVLAKFTDVYGINTKGDTIQLLGKANWEHIDHTNDFGMVQLNEAVKKQYRTFVAQEILPIYYEDEWPLDCTKLGEALNVDLNALDCKTCFGIDRFSPYGILPYHLPKAHRRLTEAFQQGNVPAILRISAEIGHYIGDAHVPLHTTENYNGQLTNQVGIHAFWESRIPELFADREYDFFVGPAKYIENANTYFWDAVLTSHQSVEQVLAIERELSQTFPQDQQYCYEERLNLTIRTQCQAYAKAYTERMEGMVEERMRSSILAIGSAWYSAWVDAGQPDLNKLDTPELSKREQKQLKELEEAFQKGSIKGRVH